MSGKRGRPPEDRLARQREIYERVAPLILELGPRRLTMRQAARAACLSLGGLHHYFPTKRALVLHAFEPEAFARICADFNARAEMLAESDPDAYLAAFVEHSVAQISFVRPALHAALELGAETFWESLDAGINAGLDSFVLLLGQIVPTARDPAPRAAVPAHLLRRAPRQDDERRRDRNGALGAARWLSTRACAPSARAAGGACRRGLRNKREGLPGYCPGGGPAKATPHR